MERIGASIGFGRKLRAPFIRRIALLALAFLTLAPAMAAAEDGVIGNVRVAKGDAAVLRGGETLPLAVGAAIYRMDELVTGKDGALGVTFKDGTRISLGPDGRLSLKAFEFEPAQEKLSFVARLTYGTLQFISGVISSLAPESVAVETPVATIAVRGTRFLVRIPKPDA